MATVKETYKQRQAEIKIAIKYLQTALSKHAEEFKKHETNWGFIGDLNDVKSSINNIEDFIKPSKK